MNQCPFKLPLTRRSFIAGTAATAGTIMLGRNLFARDFFRFDHGKFDITVLSDGFITLPVEILLPDADEDQRLQFLQRLGGDTRSAPVQANIPLIRYGSDLILIDNGSGNNFQASAGMLEQNLAILGVDPLAITKVIFTHAHPDHSGATVQSDGSLRYPNADYYVSRTEWDFWTDVNFKTRRPQALHSFALGAQRDLLAVRDRVNLVGAGDEIVPGMQIVATGGHTPGHISVELSGSERLLVTGDACTSDVIFFERPDWHFGFDMDPDKALENRKMLLDWAASEKIKMLGYHWQYPGIGYAERKGKSYRFITS